MLMRTMGLKSGLTATALAMAAGLLGETVVMATPASANVSQGYIYGAGSYNDDWGDEGPLDYNSHNYSRAVAIWQLVLKTEGLYTGAIDCDFGPATTAATKAFQQRYGLTIDGSAGPQTMGTASQRFYTISNDYPDFVGYHSYYTGNTIDFWRNNGVYYGYFNGDWRSASYTSTSGC